ncbi:Golgi-associated plant pathogenesis-related protein 1-like [Drosophila pseudoobscura]|uniref:Golgi-associated plant pathogenesis-related protein 1-like n=1 Tax=Drosophila pseudoobscura pseudoobscura TaxID=46245 RepID=A0A6I8UQR7_DROPS|nr:Golgi-associated plant pathogenesis-related protein 1 [Drosophila pseudoobscura]
MRVKSILILLAVFWFAHIHADFAEDGLKKHNEYRKMHGVPALKLDSDITKGCESYAQTLAELGKLEHSKSEDRPGLGENLAYTYSDPLSVVKMWYDEISKYDFKKPGFNMETGHFTQVVWKASTHLGMGKATDKLGRIWVVGRYKPPGNFKGQFEENVPRRNYGNSIICSTSLGFAALTLILVLN